MSVEKVADPSGAVGRPERGRVRSIRLDDVVVVLELRVVAG